MQNKIPEQMTCINMQLTEEGKFEIMSVVKFPFKKEWYKIIQNLFKEE